MTQLVMTASNWLESLAIGIQDWYQNYKKNKAHKALVKRTRRELSQLSDHELRDLGIGRSDITSIANGTFHDKRINNVKTNSNLKGWV
jgi:uncharacterized protein YjiS (DUF1127 family)